MKHAIIPAAGLATRFLPASKSVPKELFPLFDRPVIQHIVEEARDAGISDVIFVTGEGKESILDHFDRINPRFPVAKLSDELSQEVQKLDNLTEVISIRQKHPKGLGHAVVTGANIIEKEPYCVLLPDVFLYREKGKSMMQRMVELYNKTSCSVIALMEVPDEDREKYGMVEGEIDGAVMKINQLVEKPGINGTSSNLAIVGRYLFTPAITPLLRETKPGAKGEIQLTDAINQLAETETVYGLVLEKDELVFDTGDKKGYALAQAFLASRKIDGFTELLQSYLEDK